MLVLVVLLVVTVVGVRLALRRRAPLALWWTRTVGPWRPWLSRLLGSRPTFGSLQRAVLADAIRQRTVSVTGSVWLPAELVVDLADEDREIIEHAPGPFLTDVAEALTALAGEHGWRLDGSVVLRFAAEPTAKPGLPRVTVSGLVGPLAGIGAVGAGLRGPNAEAGLRGPNAGAGLRGPNAGAGGAGPAQTAPPAPAPADPMGLPPTSRYGDAGAPPMDPPPVDPGHTELVGRDLTDAGRVVRAPGLLLDPEETDGAPIVLGGTDAGAVIGRTRPADIVVSEPTVSAQHCRLVLSGSRWCIEDLGSSNGTIVNGERIGQRRELVTGDVVSLGRRARYRVHL
jgi:hypothetical protein